MKTSIPLNEWLFSVPEKCVELPVSVPHTWNVTEGLEDYRGKAKCVAVYTDQPIFSERKSLRTVFFKSYKRRIDKKSGVCSNSEVSVVSTVFFAKRGLYETN